MIFIIYIAIVFSWILFRSGMFVGEWAAHNPTVETMPADLQMKALGNAVLSGLLLPVILIYGLVITLRKMSTRP